MAANIKDVARRAGVSTTTVSRYLSDGQQYVSEEVRERIRQAMAELDYRPSRVARSLRSQKSKIIGLIISDIQAYLFQTVARAVEDIAYKQHYAVFLCNTDENIDKARVYVDILKAEGVAGAIVTPTSLKNDPCRELVSSGIPVVAIDRSMSDLAVDSVVVDNEQGAFEMVSHLVADGHRLIATILGSTAVSTTHERYAGYCRGLEAHGLPLIPDYTAFISPNQAVGNILSEASFNLTRKMLALPERPTALFTGNHLLTLGALRAIQQAGLKIQSDISLVGFDDAEWMSMVKPGITTVSQPSYQIGNLAVEQLLKRIEGDSSPPQTIVAKTRLEIRQSCGPHD